MDYQRIQVQTSMSIDAQQQIEGRTPSMCLLFLYLTDKPGDGRYRLVVASNRDEYWVRPTATAAFRGNKQEWIGGMDLVPGREGGTWLGMSRTGKLGVLLNVLAHQKPDMKGRGTFVTEFITGDKSCEEFLETISAEVDQYNPFHLLLLDLRLDPSSVHYINNSGETNGVPRKLPTGIYGADNSVIDHPWEKCKQGRQLFENIVNKHGTLQDREALVGDIIELLNEKSTRYYPDAQLEKQLQGAGRPTDYPVIRELSALCVWSPSVKCGTRTNTVILVDAEGNCEYIERSLCTPVDVDNPTWTTKEYKFKLQ